GDWGVRREAPRLMSLLLRQSFTKGLLPEDFAAGPVESESDEFLSVRDGKVVVVARRGARLGLQSFAKWESRGEKDAVSPNNGRGMSAAGDFRLPADIRAIRFLPCEGRSPLWRFPRGEGAAPLSPILQCGILRDRLRRISRGSKQQQ